MNEELERVRQKIEDTKGKLEDIVPQYENERGREERAAQQ